MIAILLTPINIRVARHQLGVNNKGSFAPVFFVVQCSNGKDFVGQGFMGKISISVKIKTKQIFVFIDHKSFDSHPDTSLRKHTK